MGFHKVDDLSESIFLNYRIGIQQEDELALRLKYGLIVGFGKTGVFAIGNNFELREFFLHHLHTTIH